MKRREFLHKTASAVGAALAAPAFLPSHTVAAAGRPGLHDRLTVGLIGPGHRAHGLLKDAPPDLKLISLADCDLAQMASFSRWMIPRRWRASRAATSMTGSSACARGGSRGRARKSAIAPRSSATPEGPPPSASRGVPAPGHGAGARTRRVRGCRARRDAADPGRAPHGRRLRRRRGSPPHRGRAPGRGPARTAAAAGLWAAAQRRRSSPRTPPAGSPAGGCEVEDERRSAPGRAHYSSTVMIPPAATPVSVITAPPGKRMASLSISAGLPEPKARSKDLDERQEGGAPPCRGPLATSRRGADRPWRREGTGGDGFPCRDQPC
jgi:hypothetical protein